MRGKIDPKNKKSDLPVYYIGCYKGNINEVHKHFCEIEICASTY